MALSVHLLITFPCDGTLGVVELAQHHLVSFPEQVNGDGTSTAVRQFLTYLAAGNGIDCGTKGGRFAWGIVGNNINSQIFAEVLRPFWQELLNHFTPPPLHDWDGPLYYESILIFSEAYEVGHASLIEIYNRNDYCVQQIDLVIETRDSLPFTLARSSEYPPTFTK